MGILKMLKVENGTSFCHVLVSRLSECLYLRSGTGWTGKRPALKNERFACISWNRFFYDLGNKILSRDTLYGKKNHVNTDKRVQKICWFF